MIASKQDIVNSDIPDASELETLSREFEDKSPQEVIDWALRTYGSRVAISTSFQAEGMVILDMAYKIDPEVRVITIDTGRLPQETYDLIDNVRSYYELPIDVYFPDASELEEMVNKHGTNPFYRSVSLRLLCCGIRKVNPLNRALEDLDAWMTGLRRGQGDTRTAVRKLEIDSAHRGIAKINPLADWTHDQVWEYIKIHDVPVNDLYEHGYTSIGCAPCTRATEDGEDPRAGRWWWESGMSKECGIHLGPAWGRTT